MGLQKQNNCQQTICAHGYSPPCRVSGAQILSQIHDKGCHVWRGILAIADCRLPIGSATCSVCLFELSFIPSEQKGVYVNLKVGKGGLPPLKIECHSMLDSQFEPANLEVR